MTKKKIENLEPKTWKKLVMIQTGEGYITQEKFAACRGWGIYTGEPLSIESTLFETTEPGIISFAEALQSKDEEIQHLKEIILNFKAAQEKVMAQS